ncbi:hypothetical protein [Asticcacaulis sp. YBE204]|uniref:hypothetical protein n=1 Tax=Asticcacaulis sp. YBE204 TaxID=1282363 RepID=UPI0003C3FDAD|nr:hypothetical protein [Asticcacaulis sp. YBE204]ESQ76916.1 hypothetical protein AEYBE204_18745 [Asticcacaulis sp. YBE204]
MGRVTIKGVPDDVLAEAEVLAGAWFDRLNEKAAELAAAHFAPGAPLTKGKDAKAWQVEVLFKAMMRRCLVEIEARHLMRENDLTRRLQLLKNDIDHLQRNSK